MKRLASLLLAFPLWAAAPNYSASSILNAASNAPGPVAPNTIVSLYGTNLSVNTARATFLDDAGLLPTFLAGTGVTVYVNNSPAALYYVSPTQINFLMPATLRGSSAELVVMFNGVRGPKVEVGLADVAPALFQLDPDFAVATRRDGGVIGRENPAISGEVVTLYATGLGEVVPPVPERQVADRAAPLAREAQFTVVLDGVAVPRRSILYAGTAPGFVALYQINVELPAITRENPELRIGFGSHLSREGLRLLAKP